MLTTSLVLLALGAPRIGVGRSLAHAAQRLQGVTASAALTPPCLDDAAICQESHLAEVHAGIENFGGMRSGAPARSFEDVDFRTRAVGVGYAGPDEFALRGGHLVHSTCSPVLDAAECAAVITEAQAAMARGQTSRFTYTAASRLSEVHVSELPAARAWLADRLQDTLWPLLESRFGTARDRLAVYDALVIKYDASRGGTRQPMHRDAALLSLNIALNDAEEYRGGGTFFEALDEVVTLPCGHATCHASGVRHAGHAISAGERWLLVVFALEVDSAQLGRRCGERGVELRRAGDLAGARSAFLAGLRAAPRDHELHHGLATVLAMEGEEAAALESLRRAAQLYPFCPKPRNGMGAVLLHAGRTAEALEAFESALVLSSEPDDDDGWDASVNCALCAVILAEEAAASEAAAGGELAGAEAGVEAEVGGAVEVIIVV